MPNEVQEQGKPQLVMKRDNLSKLPSLTLPAGYMVRSYRQGDEEAWNQIIRESFGHIPDFSKDMKGDEAFRPERIWFICWEDIPAATASAWYRPKWGENTGYLHMVGCRPAHTGKGLGYQVSLAAMHQMAKEGREKVILETDDFRLPALASYLKLDFQPVIVHENQRLRWKNILTVLGKTSFIDKFSRILEGPIYCQEGKV